MKIDFDHIGYEFSGEDSLLDVVDNFIHSVFQWTVNHDKALMFSNLSIFRIYFCCCGRQI